jgi:hypothetical protein
LRWSNCTYKKNEQKESKIMNIKPFTLIIALPILGLVIAGGHMALTFSNMPTSESITGMSDSYEMAELPEEDELLAMADTET